jgi:hypothetical protein
MFIKLLIISVLMISLILILLGIKILLKKKGQFPDTHISHNKEMRERGISCAQKTDLGCNPGDDMSGCPACGLKDPQPS